MLWPITLLRMMGVHGELLLKLLREAGIALGSESANGSYSMWVAVYLATVNTLDERSGRLRW
ncbi:MAG: hypothetical protein QNL03_10230, partial [Gammaproteobacteria bacterium]|nr:hypothetical protein [Gammaproteobacteria bacterium]